jgi:SprT protein
MNRQQLQAILSKYLPAGSEEYATELMLQYKIQLKIKKPRLSKLGDYRPPKPGEAHRISLNKDLNPFAFLVTFLHEVAHLVNFEEFRGRVAPHGSEWKSHFQQVSVPIFNKDILPTDVYLALLNYLKNPKASSCTDANLVRTLRKYDLDNPWILVEDIGVGLLFETQDGRQFRKLERMRTRYRCKEESSGRIYLVPGLMNCKPIL